MKICIKCSDPKPIEDFYVHAQMADGRLGKCKQCCKDDSNVRRKNKIEEIRVYDRLRDKLPHRVEARKIYAKENPEPFVRSRKKWLKNNPEKRLEYQNKITLMRRKNPEKTMWFAARGRAKRKGVPFTIVIEDIFIPDVCPALNIKLIKGGVGGPRSDNTPSLDEIHPGVGYIPGNISVISWKANKLKSNATFSELKSLVSYMNKALLLPESPL